jgi:signal transduction histidine kinase
MASEIASEIKESLGFAREMAEELQPVRLLENGFLAAIHELAERTEKRSGIPCQVTAESVPEDFDALAGTHLYRIAQEAINNVIAHAHATSISIKLAADEGRIILSIADDGVGFSRPADHGPGMGLCVMQYRSDLIGAELEIQSRPGEGTIVICLCPLPAAAKG